MFVQVLVVEGVDQDALQVVERWMDEVRPGAIGWLGSTAGVTDEHRLVLVARFASADEARRNAERPEQDAWWREASRELHGRTTFHDCTDVALLLDGGRDTAGFVQVIEGRATERIAAAELAEATARFVRLHRPDVIGGLVGVTDDGVVVQVVYFTSEEEARAHERAELPPEARAEVDRVSARLDGDPTYHDLHRPMLVS